VEEEGNGVEEGGGWRRREKGGTVWRKEGGWRRRGTGWRRREKGGTGWRKEGEGKGGNVMEE
jgi:hypothetical protein